jgi:hypothetical protein
MDKTVQATERRAPGGAKNTYTTICLRPIPESRHLFDPLWQQRLAVEERQGEITEMMFAAARAGDMAAHQQHREALDGLQLEHERLSREMRPLQFKAWERADPNLLTNVGRDDLNDKYWRASSYTQTVVMGLKGTGSAAAGDTQASHAGWLEVGGANAPTYSGNRKAVTMGASASQVSVSPQQSYSITSTGTVAGLFMNNGGSSTKDNTTGVLVSASDFSGGSEAVDNGDTLLVTYTFNG